MCTSNITKKKFIKLLIEVYFYNIVLWCIFFFTGYEAFSVKGFLKMIFPFFTVADNFTSCFLLFYLLIPFLNKLIHALTEKEHFLLMAWCISVYVFLPSFAKANVVFNYITWFSILYVIASYIRLYPKEWFSNVKVTGSIAGVSLLLSWVSIIVLAMLSRMVGKGVGICTFSIKREFENKKIIDLTVADDLTYEQINSRLECTYKEICRARFIRSRRRGRAAAITVAENNKIKNAVEDWAFKTYLKLMSEQIFKPLEDTDDRNLMYAPFQCVAQYFLDKGYSGIKYKSTVCESAKDIVLFDKTYAHPVGDIKDFII